MLDSTGQEQDHQDDKHQTEAAAWSVTPAAAMGPGWNGTDQEKDDHDQQNGSKGHNILTI